MFGVVGEDDLVEGGGAFFVCQTHQQFLPLDDELAYKRAFPRAFITWSVSMEGFLGEEGCVPHRGMAYCSPRNIIYFFKENAYHLKIYAVLWR